MNSKDYEDLFQGRRMSQVKFSQKMIDFGYYGAILCILYVMVYKYFV